MVTLLRVASPARTALSKLSRAVLSSARVSAGVPEGKLLWPTKAHVSNQYNPQEIGYDRLVRLEQSGCAHAPSLANVPADGLRAANTGDEWGHRNDGQAAQSNT